MAEEQTRLNQQRPWFIDAAKRIDLLDEYRIDHQLVTMVPYLDPNVIPVGNLNGELAEFANESLAKTAKESKGRLWAIGTVPLLSSPEQRWQSMERAIKSLGMKGFLVPTNVGGVAIDKFDGFWSDADKLGAVVLIHPVDTKGSTDRPYENEYDLMHVFGWPFETTLMLSRLVFSGTMERCPNLNVISHHLGAMIPFYYGRILESYGREGRLEQFKRFYHDTAVGGSLAALVCGYKVFGAERMVFGTDFPFGPEGGKVRLAQYPDLVRQLNLSQRETEMILGGNTRRILRNDSIS